MDELSHWFRWKGEWCMPRKAPVFLALVLAALPVLMSASTITINHDFDNCVSAGVGFWVPPGHYEAMFVTTEGPWITWSGDCTLSGGCSDSRSAWMFVGLITDHIVIWEGDDPLGREPHYTWWTSSQCNP